VKRRQSREVKIGNVKIGGGAPVSIQTMVKMPLKDSEAVLGLISELKEEGCDIIRLAYKDPSDYSALKEVVGKSALPVEVDIHFDQKLALQALEAGAHAIRINPGNIKREDLEGVVKMAKEMDRAIRIGVNVGSLPERKGESRIDSMVNLALNYASYLENLGFHQIIVSIKSDSVEETYLANLKLASLCDYPLHIGVTATGMEEASIVKSSIGIGALLLHGIGDTVRVSITGSPFIEVKIAKEILRALNLRQFGPEIISCPGCGRAQIDIIEIAKRCKEEIEKLKINEYIKIAVMGCEVNGPGEAKEAHIGIAGGKGCAVIFKQGKIFKRVEEDRIVDALVEEVKKMVKEG
jgi:(E)-4-hydroxy-3-methylbut-2-enyl-diphosphate synthase